MSLSQKQARALGMVSASKMLIEVVLAGEAAFPGAPLSKWDITTLEEAVQHIQELEDALKEQP